jgi:hypothetical protein
VCSAFVVLGIFAVSIHMHPHGAGIAESLRICWGDFWVEHECSVPAIIRVSACNHACSIGQVDLNQAARLAQYSASAIAVRTHMVVGWCGAGQSAFVFSRIGC